MELKSKISHPHHNLFLLDLDQDDFPGFRKFISTWIYHSNKLNFIVDPGPVNTINEVISALKELRIKRLDYILLTHIHLDHGGGSGYLLDFFPSAKVICHEKAVKHLVDPSKLNNGSLAVLGKLGETFGLMKPVSKDKIAALKSLDTPDGKIIITPTPGHAVHHQSFLFRELLFAGEALGTTVAIDSGYYQRLATPPPFKYEIFMNSIRVIEEMDPKYLCMAHYGFRQDAKRLISGARSQLEFWMDYFSSGDGAEITDPQILFDNLIKIDPALTDFFKLPGDICERERYFSKNSINGIKEFIRQENDDPNNSKN